MALPAETPWIPPCREVLGTWSEGREKQRASLLPIPIPHHSRVQSELAPDLFPALLLGLSPEPLWFCPIPMLIPRKTGEVT